MSLADFIHLSHEEKRCLLKPFIPVNKSIDLIQNDLTEDCSALCQYFKEHDSQEPKQFGNEPHRREGSAVKAFYARCLDAIKPCSGTLEDCISRKYPELYGDAVNRIISENVFVTTLSNTWTRKLTLDEEILDSLDPTILSKIRHCAFRLHLRHEHCDRGWKLTAESLEILEVWKAIMKRLQKMLSWDQLHLNIIFKPQDPAGAVFVMNVIRSLPQLENCGISIGDRIEPSFKVEAMALTKNLIRSEIRHPDAGNFHREFKFYNSLPKELRLLVLSSVGLIPYEDYEINKIWSLCGTQWYSNQSCCGVCGGGSDRLFCCCKWFSNAYSTSCRCNDPFWSILGVSKQFRAEALSVLFTNKFEFIGSGRFSESALFAAMTSFLNWKPSAMHLHLMKSVRLTFQILELNLWHENQVKFATELTKILRIFLENTTSSNVLELDLGGLKANYDEHWNNNGWRRLQLFQDDICTILKQLHAAFPTGCKIFIDWTKWRLYESDDDEASERDNKAREAERHSLTNEETEQLTWRRSDWIKYAPVEMTMNLLDYGPDACFVRDDGDE